MNQSFDLNSFDKHSKQEWIEAVTAELKGKNPDVQLAWSHVRDLPLRPMYHPKDLVGISPGQDSRKHNRWLNLCMISDPAELSTDLMQHCDGLLVDLTGGGTPWDVLAAVPQDKPLHLLGTDLGALRKLHSMISGKHLGSLGVDLLDQYEHSNTLESDLKEIMELSGSHFANSRIITIPGNQWVDQGADMILELALSLAQLATYYQTLIQLQVEPEEIVSSTAWATGVGQDFFHEVSKVRAFRRLGALIQESFGLPQRDIPIYASTSARYKTSITPTNNLIRNTVEATSAVVGGCTTLCVVPPGDGLEAKRTALDVANLLQEESYFNRVVDPAAGSYFMENLTDEIAGRAWACFQKIDSEGGYLQARQSGWIARELSSSRSWLDEQMKEGAIRMVNVNHYRLDQPQVGSLPYGPDTYRLAADEEKEVDA